MRGKGEKVFPQKGRAAVRHLIAGPTRKRIAERRLARAIGPHDRVDFPGIDRERQALENRLIRDSGVEVGDRKHLKKSYH